jgi:hypothetical protein
MLFFGQKLGQSGSDPTTANNDYVHFYFLKKIILLQTAKSVNGRRQVPGRNGQAQSRTIIILIVRTKPRLFYKTKERAERSESYFSLRLNSKAG